MIKIDLITGFLGSGKTTLILKYVMWLLKQGFRVAVLENDYGAVNIDMLLLHGLEEAGCELEMIAGGCDYDCHVRRFRTKLISMAMRGFDRVVVEPSGIFDADEFFDLLHEEPIDRWYEAGSVIGVVDAGLPEKLSPESEYFLVSQLANAGQIIMSRTQEYSEESVKRTVNHINRAMQEYGCSRVFSEGEILSKNWDALESRDFERIRDAGMYPADHVKIQVLSSNAFMSLYFLDIPIPITELSCLAEDLFRDESRYGRVIRIKGFHWENEHWYELNAAYSGFSVQTCGKGQEVLLVIGEDLQQDNIASRIIPDDRKADIWHNGQVYKG